MSSDTPQALSSVVVGIDVAKDRLDVHIWPSRQSFITANTRDGVKELLERLSPITVAPHSIGLVVLEATGRYERR